jgi:hypothetical protein
MAGHPRPGVRAGPPCGASPGFGCLCTANCQRIAAILLLLLCVRDLGAMPSCRPGIARIIPVCML